MSASTSHPADDVAPRDRRSAAWGRLGLGLACAIVLAPIVVACVAELGNAADRRNPAGDLALIAAATEDAASLRALRGPYSRYGFAHPGPALFYVLAPVQSAFGAGVAPHLAAGLFFAAVWYALHRELVGAKPNVARSLAVAACLAGTAMTLTRSHRFGTVFAHAWNPSVALAATWGVAAAALAVRRGVVRASIPLAGCLALAIQSHAAAVPIALALGATALPALGRAFRERRTRTPVVLAGMLLAFAFLPVALEAASGGGGNLRAMASYVERARDPAKAGIAIDRALSFAAAPVVGLVDAFGADLHRMRRAPFLALLALLIVVGSFRALRDAHRAEEPHRRRLAEHTLAALVGGMLTVPLLRGVQPIHLFLPFSVAGTLLAASTVASLAAPAPRTLPATRRHASRIALGLVAFVGVVASARASALAVERRTAIASEWPSGTERARVAHAARCVAAEGRFALRLEGKAAWIPGATAAFAALDEGTRPTLDPVVRGVFGTAFRYGSTAPIAGRPTLVVRTLPLATRTGRGVRPTIELGLRTLASGAYDRLRTRCRLLAEAP